jgi:hypothetical protein
MPASSDARYLVSTFRTGQRADCMCCVRPHTRGAVLPAEPPYRFHRAPTALPAAVFLAILYIFPS